MTFAFQNALKLAIFLAGFTLLQWFAAINGGLFESVPRAVLISLVGLLYAVIGGAAYMWFRGRKLIRVVLVVAIPTASNLILEVVLSNPGYSGIMILLIL